MPLEFGRVLQLQHLNRSLSLLLYGITVDRLLLEGFGRDLASLPSAGYGDGLADAQAVVGTRLPSQSSVGRYSHQLEFYLS